jgi:multidrug resistance efflux pump
MTNAALLLLGIAVAGQTFGSDLGTPSNEVVVEHCVVSTIDHAQLPAQLAGMLTNLDVEDGDQVKEGDVLGKIDETETLIRLKAAQFKLNVASEKATNDSQIKLTEKLIELYREEYKQSLAINARSPGTISESELRLQRVKYEKAVLDSVVAKMDFKIAGLEEKVTEVEVEAVENELERRTLRAPFDGIVEQTFRKQSEWVREGDPVLYLLRMDRLRVEGFVDADKVSPQQIAGAKVEITVDLLGETEATLDGKIDFISPTVESNGDYRVWAEVDNSPQEGGYPWLLRPGVEAKMVIFKRG